MSKGAPEVAVLWPAPPSGSSLPALAETRLAGVADALQRAGLAPFGVPYADVEVESIEARLIRADGVLVWVNPIEQGRGRAVLDALLRRVARAGVYVSAHPYVIEAIGTKEVLYATRDMTWGSNTELHRTFEAFASRFAESLAAGMPRVVKQRRGNGGQGVWKVEIATDDIDPATRDAAALHVRVREAVRGAQDEVVTLAEFVSRCRPYFVDGGYVIDQAYQPRLADGMVRCYLAGDRVVGFGEQLVNALLPAAGGHAAPPPAGPRLYYAPTRPDLAELRERVEREWVPELCRLQGMPSEMLPVIWDIDLLHGAGAEWVLCEINVSCVFPFPQEGLDPLAQLVRERLSKRRKS
jgi:hypothetical protein